jgi:hypothetical protein
MSALWHFVLYACIGCWRTISFAAGADSSAFLLGFLRAFSRSEKVNQRRFAFLFPLAFNLAHQATDFVISQGSE